MKFNLKNRPIFESDPMHIGDRFVEAKELEKWFEGFEKELREKLVHPTNTKSVAVYDFIKEILGETNNEG